MLSSYTLEGDPNSANPEKVAVKAHQEDDHFLFVPQPAKYTSEVTVVLEASKLSFQSTTKHPDGRYHFLLSPSFFKNFFFFFWFILIILFQKKGFSSSRKDFRFRSRPSQPTQSTSKATTSKSLFNFVNCRYMSHNILFKCNACFQSLIPPWKKKEKEGIGTSNYLKNTYIIISIIIIPPSPFFLSSFLLLFLLGEKEKKERGREKARIESEVHTATHWLWWYTNTIIIIQTFIYKYNNTSWLVLKLTQRKESLWIT